jgi:hypothetical protein
MYTSFVGSYFYVVQMGIHSYHSNQHFRYRTLPMPCGPTVSGSRFAGAVTAHYISCVQAMNNIPNG